MDVMDIYDINSKLHEINDKIIASFCEGAASMSANKDVMEYKPGSIARIQDLLSKRNLLLELAREMKNTN